ncbi:FmdE family protein [Candidatus Riflebacteria bacterium]
MTFLKHLKSPVDLSSLPEELQKAIELTWDFHTKTAPGVLIGCYLVDALIKKLSYPGDGIKYNAISETRVCLVDCIQVMTGCTFGNKYLKVKDSQTIGRYALSIYDRKTCMGYRAFLDISRVDKDATPFLYRFMTRTRDPQTRESRRREDGIETMKEFMQVAKKVISVQQVKIHYPAKEPVEAASTCMNCNETYLLFPELEHKEGLCRACSGHVKYYTIQDTKD